MCVCVCARHDPESDRQDGGGTRGRNLPAATSRRGEETIMYSKEALQSPIQGHAMPSPRSSMLHHIFIHDNWPEFSTICQCIYNTVRFEAQQWHLGDGGMARGKLALHKRLGQHATISSTVNFLPNEFFPTFQSLASPTCYTFYPSRTFEALYRPCPAPRVIAVPILDLPLPPSHSHIVKN